VLLPNSREKAKLEKLSISRVYRAQQTMGHGTWPDKVKNNTVTTKQGRHDAKMTQHSGSLRLKKRTGRKRQGLGKTREERQDGPLPDILPGETPSS